MSQRTLFFIQLALVFGVLGAHIFIFLNDLYWHYWWLDIPMHFLGGLWAALASTWMLRVLSVKASFLYVLLGVIAIGISWEIMEYVIGFQREEDHLFDTSLDLIMDALGGSVGYILARREKQRDTIFGQ